MAQPGWFPDPGGQAGMFRYWDGTAWTDQLSADPGGQPPSGKPGRSGLLIAAGQLGHILGTGGGGSTLPEVALKLWAGFGRVNPVTLMTGGGVLIFLWLARSRLKSWLILAGMAAGPAGVIARAAPVIPTIPTCSAVWSALLTLQALPGF